MYRIGSGSVKFLLAKNKDTKSYKGFIEQFFGIKQIDYNAYFSPIHALRIGQITEDRYYEILEDDWYSQVRVVCPECKVLQASIDFAKMEKNKVTEFQEVKTINFDEFIHIDSEYNVKKKKKAYYEQIQHQLLCTGLDQCTLTFICVFDYNDETAYTRVIKPREIKQLTVKRDEVIIKKILECAEPFELLRRNYEDSNR